MSQKILFVVYDNGSYDHIFPMGVGALAGVLKRDGHEIVVWNQDMHHWPDDHLRIYLGSRFKISKNIEARKKYGILIKKKYVQALTKVLLEY